ncbi:MAG: DUF533 domain-containing protein [Pirellulaceae bacterium]
MGGSSAPSTPEPRSSSRDGNLGSQNGPTDLGRAAKELEDLLNVAEDRRRNQPSSRGGSTYTKTIPTAPPRYPRNQPDSRPHFPTGYEKPESRDEQAMVLIRAMINAAKADGEISQDEQQTIINQLGGASREVVEFLRHEFSQPVDVREFSWSVPLGMEEQVYMMSLAGMNLDTNAEVAYLADLAHGLRLPPGTCNEIHRRAGVPGIYK